VLLVLQAISSLYYGAFLGIIVAVLTILLAIGDPRQLRRALVPLCVGAAIALAAGAAYALPYVANTAVLGVRPAGEVATFSARLASYVTAPQENWLWGWTAFRFDGDELRLFPGIAATALAALAAGLTRRRSIVVTYFVVMAVAFAFSLGFNNPVYRLLYSHVWPMQGFRAPARFAILAGCALAVLAGFGFDFLQQRFSRGRVRSGVFVAVLVAVGIECGSAPMRLEELPRQVPDLYRFLRILDRAVVIEMPILDWDLAPVYMYWSTQHWHRLVNGYSGFFPPDYAETLDRLQGFPDDRSIERLRRLDVRYIVVHEAFYKPKEHAALLLRLGRREDIAPAGRYRDWAGAAQVFELKRNFDESCRPGTGHVAHDKARPRCP
jgi:hypothetical protein